MNFKRLIAFFIDYIIILLSIFMPLMAFNFELVFDYLLLIVVIVLILVSIKDLIFRNASIGKRLLHLKIVTEKNEIPKLYQLIIRNITLFIWPIDIIVLAITKKRIGEIITKTKVINFENY